MLGFVGGGSRCSFALLFVHCLFGVSWELRLFSALDGTWKVHCFVYGLLCLLCFEVCASYCFVLLDSLRRSRSLPEIDIAHSG